MVVITTQLPGAAPEEIETDVTDKIEGAVNQISGVDDLNSVSSEGVSQVIIMFKLDKDTDVAAQEVRDKVNTVLRELPSGIEQPIISKVEPSAAPVLYLGVRGKGQSMRDLTEVADKKVRRQLETILGVGKVTIIGGSRATDPRAHGSARAARRGSDGHRRDEHAPAAESDDAGRQPGNGVRKASRCASTVA